MAISSLRAGALRFATATVLGQLVALAAMPILTRLYSPSAFGMLALFSSFYAILIPVATLKFDQAVVLPKDDETAVRIAALTVLCSILCSALVLASLTVAASFQMFGTVPWFYFLLPVALVNGAVLTVGQQWLTREKSYGSFGMSMAVTSAANVAFAGLLYFVGFFGTGLVLSFLLGNLAATAYVCFKAVPIRAGLTSRRSSNGVSGLKMLAWKYRNFPVHVLPNVLLTSLTYQALPILITHFFDQQTTGLYAVANRLLVFPSIVVGNVAAEVFKSELVSRIHAGNSPHGFFRKSLLLLLALSIPAYAMIWMLSPILFNVVFGAKFALAGTYARYLALGVACILITQIFSYTYIALDRTRLSLVFQAALSVAQIAGFILGAMQGGIERALLYTSLAAFVASVILVYVAHRLLRQRAFGPV